MMLSIRKFLLINILVAIILITSVSALGDYYLSQADVRTHMDSLLEQMGVTFAVVVANNIDKANIKAIEKELDLIQNDSRYMFFVSNLKSKNALFTQGKYYFQLWDDSGNLLLYSTKANHLDFDAAPIGLSDLTIQGTKWRIFKIHDNAKQINFVVGERYDIRNQLLHRIAENSFYIMLLTYPISGLLIWVIVGWGFKSLQRITNEVSNRAPSYLEPVALHEAPIEIKPLIEELNSLFERLHEAFEREKRFAADAAHELRTPLAALKTQAQVVTKTTDENERKILLENLIHGVDRIVHIVQQLLTLSRLVPEAASVYDVVEINLSKLSAEIIAQLVPMALEKNIEIELDAPETSTIIRGNLTGLSILIRNLVDNAIRYTPENGSVRVEIDQTDDYIILRVIDTGPGIPEELRARVFERFYRVIGNNASGSGLGLAIVQQIAQLHQAIIKLKSPKSGRGLQFEVYFPRINY
jgi:two-component system, OmpR family, sensor histidine kinase QseC